MSAIERETSEYVEMSDSITLCIVKDGAAGTSINMKTGVSSPDALPSSGASIGDSYIIDGHLWTYTGGTASDATHPNGFTDCGKVSGEAGKNNYVHVAWSNKQNPTKDDIVLSNTDGNAYAYMGTWVSETKEDTADEAVKMAKWVYVKGDKGADGSAYDIYLSASVLKGDSTGKLNGNDTVSVTAKVVKITGGTAVQVTDTNEAYFTISRTMDNGDLVPDWPSGTFTVTEFEAFGQGVKTWNFALYVGGTFLKTVMLPVVRDGKQGADGKGALEISVDPDTLVFDTDDDGIVPSGTSKRATIACYRDGKKVTNVDYALMEGGHPDCDASISTSNSTATVTISNIAKDETYGVSKTSGTVEVQVYDKDKGRYYFPTVKFSVNVAKFNGGLKADNKKLQSQYSLLTNNGTVTDLKEYKSEILQTAKEISLKVSEKSVGRRNMLVGSAFRKQGEGCSIVQDGQDAINGICINGGYDGVNCARLRNEGDAGAAYPRISWDGGRNSNVKVAKGKKYTLSFWAKRLSSTEGGYEISTQFFLQDGANGYARPYSALKMGSFTVKSQGEWEFIQDTVTIPSNAKSNYMEVCICLGLFQRGMAEILVCRPMLEEGDEYNGWTLSEQDYDYVGGNLLDGTATLAKTGNVETLNPDNVTQGGMGESASISAVLSPTDTYVDFLQFSTDGMGLKANEDYVLSFYAKADSNPGRLQCYLYPSEGYTNTEEIEGGYDYFNPSDGSLQSDGIVPGTTWKRYWVHWRPTKNDPKHVLFRLQRGGNDRGTYSSYTTYAVDDVVLYDGTYYRCIKAGQGNTPSSSSSYWEATRYQISLSKPKLEVGATMTEWTAKRSDMVDKQALYATGIDIDSKKITLTASNTTFRGNDGKELAVIDQDGLRATKIATTDIGQGHTVIDGNSTVWFQKDGVTPGIAVFYDAAGVPHLAFYGTDGKQKYDIGPSGLQNLISSIQQAHSDTAYLRDATSVVHTNNSTLKGFEWLYVASGQEPDKRYIYRKQIPTTDASAQSGIYDGCVFTKEYSGTNWPKGGNLLANGWYVKPNDGNLPTKRHMVDEEAVFDPTKTLYYQAFYYYEGGKVARTVRAYMKRSTKSDQLVSKFEYAGSYDEIL